MSASILPSAFEPASLSDRGGRPIAICVQRTDILVAPDGPERAFKRHHATECRNLVEPDCSTDAVVEASSPIMSTGSDRVRSKPRNGPGR